MQIIKTITPQLPGTNNCNKCHKNNTLGGSYPLNFTQRTLSIKKTHIYVIGHMEGSP